MAKSILLFIPNIESKEDLRVACNNFIDTLFVCNKTEIEPDNIIAFDDTPDGKIKGFEYDTFEYNSELQYMADIIRYLFKEKTCQNH